MKGVSVYEKRPKEGQKVESWINGECGFASTVYTNGYFETCEDKGNRYVITRWKHDMWQPR